MKRNLTVELDEEVIQRARVLAAKRGSSISRLVAAEIERMTEEETRYEEAHRSALAQMKRGFKMGTSGRLVARSELYDR